MPRRWRARGRRARPALDHGAAADRRPRPPRPRLGVRARQSLRHAAAHRSGAARAWRRSFPSSPRWRVHDAVADVRAAARAAAGAQMAERPAAVDGAKLAGILIEGESGPGRRVVIGIGVNCASHPAGTAYPATDLAAAGAPSARRERCSRALSDAMLGRLAQWTAARASPPSAPTGSRAPRASGADIRVRLADREIAGRFEALDDAGRLRAAPRRRQRNHRHRRRRVHRHRTAASN